jgi:hypothetical protein
MWSIEVGLGGDAEWSGAPPNLSKASFDSVAGPESFALGRGFATPVSEELVEQETDGFGMIGRPAVCKAPRPFFICCLGKKSLSCYLCFGINAERIFSVCSLMRMQASSSSLFGAPPTRHHGAFWGASVKG